MQPLTILLDDDLADRMARVAAHRGITPEALAGQLIDAQLPPSTTRVGATLPFVGVVRSGRGDLSSTYQRLRRQRLSGRAADDV